ncbi:hypothetical protein [Kaarinaea lacus]
MHNKYSMTQKGSDFLFSILVFSLLSITTLNVFAAPQYYVFNGRITTLSDPYTSTAVKAGYEVDDFIHYVVEMDFDQQGYYISPTSGLRVTPDDTASYDYFYANLISGTEITHNTASGAVYENLGANHIDPAATSNQSYVNLASYLVLLNGTNPVDWQVGDEVRSSDRWTTNGYERIDGTLNLIDILDTAPANEPELNNWSRLTFDREIFNFLVVDSSSNTSFIGARPYGGLYRKTNNSSIISRISSSVDDTNIKDVAFIPGSTDIIYAATIHGGIYKSDNGGSSWSQSNAGIATRSNQSTDAYSVAVSPTNPDLLYSGTLFGLYKSSNAGITWQAVTTPFNDTVINIIRITAGNEIFVGTASGLFRGTVDGDSWTNLLNNSPFIMDKTAPITDITLHPVNENLIAIGVQDSGAYLYYLNEDRWEQLNVSPWRPGKKFSIEFSGASGNTIYVAESVNGLFRSDDLNGTWNRISLPTKNGEEISVNALAVDTNEQLLVGSSHNGLFSIEKAMQTSVPVQLPDMGNDVINDGGGSAGIFTILLLSLFSVFRYRRRLWR